MFKISNAAGLRLPLPEVTWSLLSLPSAAVEEVGVRGGGVVGVGPRAASRGADVAALDAGIRLGRRHGRRRRRRRRPGTEAIRAGAAKRRGALRPQTPGKEGSTEHLCRAGTKFCP